MKKPICHKCAKKSVVLRRAIMKNGSFHIFWYCPECQCMAEGPTPNYLKKKDVQEYLDQWNKSCDDIPVAYESDMAKCAVCGELGTETHHFAPVYLFGEDANNWPKAELCPGCHLKWHKKVTPEMWKTRKEE